MSIQNDKLMNLADAKVLYDDLRGRIPDVSGKLDKPQTPGTQGQVLTSDGLGGQSWEDPTGGDPTEIIDDGAGEGDTDKVWSADKSAEEVSQLNGAINGKADEPTGTKSAGKIYGLMEVDGQLVPVWITPASGGAVDDVQVNGSSIVDNGIAAIPFGGDYTLGLVKARKWATRANAHGIYVTDDGEIATISATDAQVKAGATTGNCVLTPGIQDKAVFYGLTKAAGVNMNASSNPVGTYTPEAKSAISEMLNGAETVSGTTPSITAKPGVRYICGEVSTLSITAPASGCIDVVFTSGSTATVLTVSGAKSGVTAIKWAGGFDPTSLDADTTYEINILDGEYGVACAWT